MMSEDSLDMIIAAYMLAVETGSAPTAENCSTSTTNRPMPSAPI
jgi:hypothetical protein